MNRNQPGMARAYENTMETDVKNQFTADDRHSRKLARFLKGARFRYKAAFEKIGFAVDRNPERLRLSIRIMPGKGHDWENLLSQTSAYAHQIAFTWHNPPKDPRRSAPG